MGILIQALFGTMCLLLGIVANEIIRRSNRIEAYAGEVFKKRFAVYEELWKLIRDAKPVVDTVIEDNTLSAEERHKRVSEVVLGIAKFCDEYSLYLNEDVTVHSCALYMGSEDIAALSDAKARDAARARLVDAYNTAREIIRAETGLKRLDSVFSKVTKAKYSSEIIHYFRSTKGQKTS